MRSNDNGDNAARRALLALGDAGGPLPESRAVPLVGPAALNDLVERGFVESSEPVYTLTSRGLNAYTSAAAIRNLGADR